MAEKNIMFGGKENNSVRFISALLLLVAAFCLSVRAQENIQFSQGKVEEGMSNSLGIPLMSYKGRGINLPVTLNYSSSVWRIDNINTVNNLDYHAYQTMTQAIYAEHSTSGWKSSLDLPIVEFPKSTDTYYSTGGAYNYLSGSGSPYRIARVYIHMPDGSIHELRKSDTAYTGSIDMSGNFYAVDGSRLRYYGTDADTGTLYLPDGTRYVLDAGDAELIDRNGNTLYYDGNDREWTDTLGRVIGMPFPANPEAGNYLYELPGLAGVNGGVQTYTLKWRELQEALTPDENNNTPDLRVMASHYLLDPDSAPTAPNGNNYPQEQNSRYESLFHSDAPNGASVVTMVVGKGQEENQLFNPVVLTEIVLPDGRSYKFSYNVYGEIDKVIYPTGAFEKYQIEEITGLWNLSVPYDQANRGVKNRKLSINGMGDDFLEWKYSREQVGGGAWGGGCDLYKVIAPDNTRTEVYKLKIGAPTHGPPNYREYWDFGFVDPRNGATVEKRVYSTSSNGLGGTLLRRELTEYERSVHNVTTLPNNWVIYAYRNIRPAKDVSIVFEGSGSALAQTNTYLYDTTYEMTTGLDQTQANTYHFAVISNTSSSDTAQSGTISQISTGSLANYTQTSYENGSTYQNANILGLPTVVKFRDGAGVIVSQNEIVYDESVYSPAVGRGLPTSSKVWDSTKGVVTNSSAYLVMRSTFDSYGNQTLATDAKGNSTTITYDSTYHALPVSVTTEVPDQNGGTYGSTTGFTTSTAYGTATPPLGLPISITDANGQTTMEYNDALLRPTKVTAPNGHQTITEYGAGTSLSTRYVKVKTQIDGDNWSEAYSWYDQMGRTYKSEKVDAQGNIFVLTCYDQMGRVEKVSNPFRNVTSPTCLTSLEWTINDYDDLSRLIQVKTPDNATVNTAYALATSGSQIGKVVTVQDQAGKFRRSVTNALKQLIRIDEPNDNNQLGTVSSPNQYALYSYDALNNLIQVSQGSQTRSFEFDSLSRLKEATNPESGTIKYTYDDNANLKTKRDARGIKTIYDYDAINRVIKRCYKDIGTTGSLGATTCASAGGETTEPNTPDITYYYDNITNAKGKLIKVVTGSTSSPFSKTEYTEFNTIGKVTKSKQTTDGTAYNEMEYTYNLFGTLTEQKYPSGRVVKTILDNNGNLSIVQSKKNQNTGFWNYAQHFTYESSGAVSSMQLGNGRWESAQFNNRLQPTQIALGSTQGATDKLKLDFTYHTNGNADNTGNVLSQTITVPTETRNSTTYNGFTAAQTYTYDSLNRIKDAKEIIGSTQQWKQTYTYDRFGNRSFDESSVSGNYSTTTLTRGCATSTYNPNGICDKKKFNPTFTVGDNRITQDQDGDLQNDYVFDSAGSMTKDANGNTFVYNGENKQVEVKNSSNQTIGQYWFDGDGKRIKKYVPATGETTIFVYDAWGRMVAEYSTLISQSATVNYLTNDALGSSRINTNENGIVTSRHDYRPYGDEIQRASYGNDEIRQKFTSYERDGETNLDFAQDRIYASGLGRFTSVDPVFSSVDPVSPQTWNKYTYCANNPINLVDPSGMWTWSLALGGLQTDADLEQRMDEIQNDESLTDEQKRRGVADIQNIIFQRQQFREALHLARSMVSRGLFATQAEYEEAEAAVDSYGQENDGNDVIVGIRRNNNNPARTTVEGKKIVVAITTDELRNSRGTLAFTVIHEGVHVTQGRKFAASGTNMSIADAESAAYRITSTTYGAIQAALAANGENISGSFYENSGVRLWQPGHTRVDVQIKVNQLLQRLGLLDSNNQQTTRGVRQAFPGGEQGQWN